jgi:hypothetical protein
MAVRDSPRESRSRASRRYAEDTAAPRPGPGAEPRFVSTPYTQWRASYPNSRHDGVIYQYNSDGFWGVWGIPFRFTRWK